MGEESAAQHTTVEERGEGGGEPLCGPEARVSLPCTHYSHRPVADLASSDDSMAIIAY